MTKQELVQAIAEGREAYNVGKSPVCPYPVYLKESVSAWKNGWLLAYLESGKKALDDKQFIK